MSYTIHPVADLFPMLSKPELDELANDIRDNGLMNPIIRMGDVIIDGRNRLAACKLAKVEPTFTEYKGNDPVAYIISQNIHRRHLDESQRSMIGNKIANMQEGRPSGNCANLRSISQSKAAELMNVSRRMVQDAKLVADHSPDLADKVMRGEITVHAAKQQIKQTETKTETKQTTKQEVKEGKPVKGVGIQLSNDAIAILQKIPVSDPLRELGLKTVAQWVKANI